jgi:phosphohistidine phosphatase SixA
VEDAKAFLLEVGNVSSCAFVGHQPHLGKLLSLLLCGNEATEFHFKKAGIAGVEISVTGHCQLEFFVSPKILLA